MTDFDLRFNSLKNYLFSWRQILCICNESSIQALMEGQFVQLIKVESNLLSG